MKPCLWCKKERTETVKHSFCTDECSKAWDRLRKNEAWEKRPTLKSLCKNCWHWAICASGFRFLKIKQDSPNIVGTLSTLGKVFFRIVE